MQLGTPVIAADSGANRELIEDGVSGLLYPPGEVEALSAQIRRLGGDLALRQELRRNAAQKARTLIRVGGYGARLGTLLRAAKIEGR